MNEPACRMEGSRSRFSCRAIEGDRNVPSLADDLRRGFATQPRSLPPKYFYDERGSLLFDQICDTPEYYPTRTEDALLAAHAEEIVSIARPAHLMELGAGACRKTRHLLRAAGQLDAPLVYWPFDVCEEILREAGAALIEEFQWLSVNALVGDYLGGLRRPPCPGEPTLFAFLGGTIGNFEPAQAREFLSELTAVMEPGDFLLMGADRVKAPAVLHAAYNDAAGITAEFNVNVLNVLNRELDADFDPTAFRHRAVYNEQARQIEMYLVAMRRQRVQVSALDAEYVFEAGESILTEISRKFGDDELDELLGGAGLAPRTHFLPDNGYFSLVLAERTGA